MKPLLIFVLAITFPLFAAQELELDSDTKSVSSSLESELKKSGMGDLLVEESVIPKQVHPSTVSATTTKGAITSQVKSDAVTTEESPVVAVEKKDATTNETTAQNNQSAVQSETEDTPVVEVADVNTIDIQGSLKDYRSPLKAMFFSLAIPGAGQIYAKKYVKSGIFVAAEIGAIVGAVHFKKAGNALVADAHSMADQHYSNTKLNTFYEALYAYGLNRYASDTKKVDTLIFNQLYSTDTNSSSVNKFMAAHSSDMYSESRENITTQGWDDATPGFDSKAAGTSSFFLGGTADTTGLRLLGENPYGTSVLQNNYIAILKDSEKQYRVSQTMVVAILVNHIASAADAFITANHHNRTRMNEQIESAPKVSLLSNSYRNSFGVPTTSLDVILKF